jgi:hypothetical protein
MPKRAEVGFRADDLRRLAIAPMVLSALALSELVTPAEAFAGFMEWPAPPATPV